MSLPTTLETMPLKAPRNLPSLVKATFEKARAGGDITFFPTQVALLSPNSVPFQLRFSPSLASKPTHPHAHGSDRAKTTSTPPFNPFLGPSPALLVASLEPAHNLVLNKFAVVPEHFILATKEFAPQTNVLDEQDLAATYACIDAYRTAEGDDGLLGRGELFAFFNSGPHSGASQPHRHIQMLPVERMRDGLRDDESEKWDVLADRLGSGADVDIAFETFHASISPSMTPTQLHETYLSLLHRAARAVEAFHHHHRDEKELAAPAPSPPRAGEEAGISYNIGMTARTLVVCPRLSEGAVLVRPSTEEKGEVDLVGTLTLNGTVLAGTALVKNEGEWDALKADAGALRRMLGGIGVPKGVSV